MTGAGFIKLANSNVAVGRLGFGVARLYGGAEARVSAGLIEAALVAGVRHFDTAPLYGHGQSENVLGAALAGVPDVTITTKIGVARPEGRPSWRAVAYRRYARPLLAHAPALKAALLRRSSPAEEAAGALATRRILRRDEIERGLEESLRRLRRSYVDLYLVHEPDQFVIDEALDTAFADLKRQGLIRAYGLAFGRAASDAPTFGQALQSQYRPPLRPPPAWATQIFHGVLRHASPSERPAKRLWQALEAAPTAAFIFSASAPRQIRQITGTS
jgi:D-threo-aldose 1-dehydrogenase